MKEKDFTPEGLKKALRVKTFCENLKCTQGEWAGHTIKLMPWQWEEVILPLFGTLKKDGLRQYRYCYLEIPKKSGKSPLAAMLGLYGLCADGEASPEVYIAAADISQASYVFRYAAQMVRENLTLRKRLKIVDSRRRIINLGNNGFMQVLSSESYTKAGINPSMLVFDELHCQSSDELWNTLTSGTDYARKQQVVIAMSTAGVYNKQSLWWRVRTKAQQVKAGIIKDPRFLPVLYVADPEKDNPEDEKLWIKVNPSIGHIFTLDKIREEFKEVKNDPIAYQNFLRYRLNFPIRSLKKWMPLQKWDKCAGIVDEESLIGRRCYGGLDLSLKLDMTAFIMVFEPDDDGMIDIVCKFYCPEGGIMKRSQVDRVSYDIWQQQGFLTATPGETVDYAFIEKDIVELAKKYDIQQIGFDPWKATSTYNHIMTEFNPMNDPNGFQMVEIRQGAKSMHEPAQDLLVNVMNGKIRHGGNPILRWNMDNMVMRSDANENLTPDKGKAIERIDGGVALIMAWGRMIFAKEDFGDIGISFL